MHKPIYLFYTICPSDIGVGPSKFARFDGENEPAHGQPQVQEVAVAAQVTIGHVDQADYGNSAQLGYQEPTTTPMPDVQPLSLSDLPDEDKSEEEDPRKKTPPGCPRDDKLTKDVYDNEIKKEVKRLNLDYKNPKDRHTAHLNILSLFRQRLHIDKASEEQDAKGPAEAKGAPFTVTQDKGVYYTEYKKSLREMIDDQINVRRWDVDPAVNATLLLMEKALMEGATKVEHVSHYKDKDGNEAIRDKITMIIDPNGEGRMEVHNIALEAGHNLSLKEAYDTMTKDSESFVVGHPKEGIFILTDLPLASEAVHEIISAAQRTHAVRDVYADQTPAPQYVMTEFIDTFDPSGLHLDDALQDVHIPGFIRKLLGLPPEKEAAEKHQSAEATLLSLLTDEKNNSALNALTTMPEKGSDSNKKETNLSDAWRRVAEKVLGTSREQSKRLLDELVYKFRAMQEKQAIISYSVETGVGIGAALVALDALVNLNLEPVRDDTSKTEEMKTEVVPVLLQEKDGGVVIQADAFIQAIQLVSEKKPDVSLTEVTKTDNAPDTENTPLQDTLLLRWLAEFIKTLDKQTPEEALARVETEEKRVITNLQLLWEIFEKISGDEDTTAELKTTDNEGKVHSETERQTVREFSVAVTLWMMLKYSSYYQALDSLKNALTDIVQLLKKKDAKEGQSQKVYDIVKSRLSQALAEKEPAPWLLFAIILYLAKIREQGMQTKVQPAKKLQKTVKKPTNRYIRGFETQGIIYAHSS